MNIVFFRHHGSCRSGSSLVLLVFPMHTPPPCRVIGDICLPPPCSKSDEENSPFLPPLFDTLQRGGISVNFVGSSCDVCRKKSHPRNNPLCVRGCMLPYGHLGFWYSSTEDLLTGNGDRKFRTDIDNNREPMHQSNITDWIASNAPADVYLIYSEPTLPSHFPLRSLYVAPEQWPGQSPALKFHRLSIDDEWHCSHVYSWHI